MVVLFIVSIGEAHVIEILLRIINVVVARVLFRNHAGARGLVW